MQIKRQAVVTNVEKSGLGLILTLSVSDPTRIPVRLLLNDEESRSIIQIEQWSDRPLTLTLDVPEP